MIQTIFLAAAIAMRATLPDPPLDRALADAITVAPETRSSTAAIEAARRRVEPAGTLPDPTASITWDGDRRMFTLIGSQAFPWPGKLALAARAAGADAAVTVAATGRAALTVEARVRNTWYDLELAKALDQLVDDRIRTARQIEEVARARYSAGLAAQQDVVRAELEIARLEEQKNTQHAAIASRQVELTRLVGHEVEVDTVPFSNSLAPDESLIAGALERSPELAAARAAADTARVRVDLAKKNLLPDFVVSAGPMIGSSTVALSVGGGISLPIRAGRKQKSQIAEWEAIARARDADVEALTRDLEIRTRERIESLRASIRTTELYRDKLMALDQIAFESALTGYQSGKVPFITLLEAVHSLHDDHFAYLARVAETAKWRAAIDEANVAPTAPISPATPAAPTASPAMGGPSM